MADAVSKADLFARLGYAGPYQRLEEVLERAGLSRPDRTNIAASKADAVEDVLSSSFLIVCSRGDCQMECAELADGRTLVPATSQSECSVCGGSANGRAVDAMVAAMKRAGLSRLCVVGGSPNLRVELERLVAGRVELRLVQGVGSRTGRQAQADLAWADRVAIWGGTILDHRVSGLYKGDNVIQFARRSIQELAREVARSAAMRGG